MPDDDTMTPLALDFKQLKATFREFLDLDTADMVMVIARTSFELIDVNGAPTWNDPHNKVHLIEATFQRRRFDNTNVESLT